MGLLQKIDRIFYGKHIMTDDQQEIDSIIDKCLSLSGTDCKMNSHGKYYLSNKDLHYYFIIDEDEIKLTNTKLSTSVKVSSQWYSKISNKLNDWLDADIESIENAVFSSEMSMLKQISKILDTSLEKQSKAHSKTSKELSRLV